MKTVLQGRKKWKLRKRSLEAWYVIARASVSSLLQQGVCVPVSRRGSAFHTASRPTVSKGRTHSCKSVLSIERSLKDCCRYFQSLVFEQTCIIFISFLLLEFSVAQRTTEKVFHSAHWLFLFLFFLWNELLLTDLSMLNVSFLNCFHL